MVERGLVATTQTQRLAMGAPLTAGVHGATSILCDGVSKNSLHMQGRAIDVRLDDVSTASLREAGLTVARGGVGYYRTADFVHLDTGRFRQWSRP